DCIEILEEQQRVPRLGKGVDEAKNLSKAAMRRVIKAVQEYQELLNRQYPCVEDLQVVGTSAVRDANNRKEFLNRVEKETGIDVRVLSGFEEAQYTFLGAQTVLEDALNARQKVVIDIGGGSTEVAAGERELRDRYSFNMGCVRYTERYLKGDPPNDLQMDACRKAALEMLESYEFNFVDNSILIGVSGTVSSLAFIDKGCKEFRSEDLNGYMLSLELIKDYITKFKRWPVKKLIESYPIVMEGRGDIFLAGLLILECFMEYYDFDSIITSTGGIRHGVLLDN
ncbi:MAG TPA: hypothetical protein VJ964_07890, partial [Balneolaceae bacterium]|nr:hypothetical protein [Balneolaceae bacterium]